MSGAFAQCLLLFSREQTLRNSVGTTRRSCTTSRHTTYSRTRRSVARTSRISLSLSLSLTRVIPLPTSDLGLSRTLTGLPIDPYHRRADDAPSY